jgi:hypothetical protein
LRKSGDLPLDICAVDEGRSVHCLEEINTRSPEEEAESWVEYLQENAQDGYTPISFWEDLDTFVQMTVEKIDLIGLFEPVCEEFHIPLHNISGWNDINTRASGSNTGSGKAGAVCSFTAGTMTRAGCRSPSFYAPTSWT